MCAMWSWSGKGVAGCIAKNPAFSIAAATGFGSGGGGGGGCDIAGQTPGHGGCSIFGAAGGGGGGY